MESNILNFPDAMRLAQVFQKYVDTEIPKENPLDFIKDIIGKVEPVDFLNIIKLFSGKSSEEISTKSGDELLGLFYSGMEKNKILSLIQYYKKEF